MKRLLFKLKLTENKFFCERKIIFLCAEQMKSMYAPETKEEKAYIYQIGSYAKKFKNILNIDKLKNIDKPIKLQKGNIIYSILPDPKEKDKVNVIIQHQDPDNPNVTKKLSVYSFVSGQLQVKRDVYGNLKSAELVEFFRAFNIELKEIDLIVKKEYEFFRIKQRLPGIFSREWRKPFKNKLHVKNDSLEINNSSEKVELTYFRKGEKLKWTLNNDFLLTSGDLTKLLYVLNQFSRELVDFDKKIAYEIRKERDESQLLINNLGMIFTPEDINSRVRSFAKEYKKTDSNRLFITGDGEKIIFIHKNKGIEQKWIFNADKKIQPASSDPRELYLVLLAFRPESEDLKDYLKNKDEEKKKTNREIISFIDKYPHVFMKRQGTIELKDKKEGSIIKISAAEAFNADSGKFFLTYEKGGSIKHFYFSDKALNSQTNDMPPFGAERESTVQGAGEKTYFFNTNSGQLLSILKAFEAKILQLQ